MFNDKAFRNQFSSLVILEFDLLVMHLQSQVKEINEDHYEGK